MQLNENRNIFNLVLQRKNSLTVLLPSNETFLNKTGQDRTNTNYMIIAATFFFLNNEYIYIYIYKANLDSKIEDKKPNTLGLVLHVDTGCPGVVGVGVAMVEGQRRWLVERQGPTRVVGWGRGWRWAGSA